MLARESMFLSNDASVYNDPSVYLGCFEDSSNRLLQVLLVEIGLKLTPENCRQKC